MAKPHLIIKRKYKRNVLVNKEDVIADTKKAKEVHLLEDGKMSDGTEFLVVKIIV